MSIKQFIRRKVRNMCGWNELMSELQAQQTQLQIQQTLLQAQQAQFQNQFQAQQAQLQTQIQTQQAIQAQLLQILALQAQQAQLQTQFQAQQAQLQAQQNQIQTQFQTQQHFVEDNRRSQILNRWKIVDAMDRLLYPDDFVVTCRICGHSAAKSSYETKVSQCIFNGGKLERFVCPECGCVFGPLKMFALNPQELADEYKQHYSVFDESDTTELGIKAFEQLAPMKGKVYLNYGAGRWSKTSCLLREQGYTIYDYEPFAPSADEGSWLICSPDKLREMKFDGIFSNDLIEHLPEPVADLKFMASILNPMGKMAHATWCYDYMQEFTRFHYFFFTGNSVKRLAERLNCQGEVRDVPLPEKFFYGSIRTMKVGIFSF